MLTVIAIAIGLYIGYRRFKSNRQWNSSPDGSSQKLQLTPPNVTAIIALLFVIPGFWVMSVEGWQETTTFDLETGERTTSSTFGSQFAHAMMYFAIAGALLLAAKFIRDKRIEWPPAIQQPMQRLGLVPQTVAHPAPIGNVTTVSEPQTASQFQVPPGWPVPPAGWTPPQDWTPDPQWPPAPDGWQFWTPAPQANTNGH